MFNRNPMKSGRQGDTSSAGGAITTPSMEFAHVLFMDIVGYSRLQMQQQAEIQVQLQNIVQNTQEVQNARRDNKLIVRPTGDGMALLFLRDILAPIRCAIQLHTALQESDAEIRQRVGVSIKLRMGIHSGTVLMVEDMNSQSDVAGEGIIIAQRVMDCGDAGHILLSSDVANKLLQIEPWPRYLTDLGTCRVKHGAQVHLYNLVGRLDGPFCGNAAIPKKVKEDVNARGEEIKKYRGSYFERNPQAKKWIANFSILAFLLVGGWFAWTKVPGVPKAVQATGKWFKGLSNPDPVDAKNKPKAKGKTGKIAAATWKPGNDNVGSGGSEGGGRGETSGVSTVQVPDMLGLSFEDARALAKQNGLKMARSGKSAYSSTYAQGLIYSQSPDSGRYVSKGKTITVFVSKGDAPEETSASEEAAPPKSDETEEGVGASPAGDMGDMPAEE